LGINVRRLPLALALLSVGIGNLWLTRPAEPLAPLAYTWSCSSRFCSFQATTNFHGAYQWNFGDGTLTGQSTSKTTSHFYGGTPIDGQFHTATVHLIGYAFLGAGSPDNIIACDIVYAAAAVGIGTSGTCQ
jgi:hypothetical protein